MESEHFIGKVAQKAVIEKNGKVLICRHPHDRALWELPGGRLHRNEELRDGLKREIMEELGVESDVHEIFYGEQYVQTVGGDLHILLTYKASLINPEQEFVLDPIEIREIKWIDASQISDQEIYPNCLRALQAYFGVR